MKIYKEINHLLIFKTIFFITLLTIEFLATTSRDIEVVSTGWDKSNHFLAFMVLYVQMSLAFHYLTTIKKVLWLFLFAVQIEVVQYFIPNRYFSLLDIVADLIGILIGYFLFRYYKSTLN